MKYQRAWKQVWARRRELLACDELSRRIIMLMCADSYMQGHRSWYGSNYEYRQLLPVLVQMLPSHE